MFRIKNLLKKSDVEIYKPSDETTITYQSTSFGRVYKRMLNEFAYNLLGQRVLYTDTLSNQCMKFIYPEEEQVLNSHLGSQV